MRELIMNFIKTLPIVFATMGLFMFQSCDNLDSVIDENSQTEVQAENLTDLTASDLENMKEILKAAGVNLDALDIYANQTTADGNSPLYKASVMDILVRAIKVTTTTKNPDGSGATIPISGVLLVPRLSFFPLRFIVAAPPTYTHNEDAPSNIFKTLSLVKTNGNINHLYFFTLQATQGFAVLFPDYPGFGDSYQKAFIPYLMKEQMVTSTIDLIKGAQETLKKNRYSYKKELILTGYSLGAFVATFLAKELDTNKDLPVKLTVTGGTPVNLKEMMDYAKSSESLTAPYIYPYTLLAYSINEKNIPFAISDVLKAPYNDKAYLTDVFDGTHYEEEVMSKFPDKPSELFTEEFINQLDTHPNFANIRLLMNKNTLEPWKNINKIVFVHGTEDAITNYRSSMKFYDKQKELGGNVSFSPIFGTDHITAALAFYIEVMAWLNSNK